MQIYTTFYCRQNEPSYIKSLKLDILAAIADETNAFEIATELTEYVNDIDEQLARNAVKAVGRIAIEVSSMHHSRLSECRAWMDALHSSCYMCRTTASSHLLAPPCSARAVSACRSFSPSPSGRQLGMRAHGCCG